MKTAEDIGCAEEELEILHSVTQDILDKNISQTIVKKDKWKSEETLDMMQDRRNRKKNDITT